MDQTVLIGRGANIETLSRRQWEEQLSKVPQAMKIRLGFMTRQHHLIRYFVVRSLPRIGRPIAPELIAAKLMIPVARVKVILAELEERLFFLVRNELGQVSWAYPVTAEQTRHSLIFSNGERIYAA
jgi:hypothetical protein